MILSGFVGAIGLSVWAADATKSGESVETRAAEIQVVELHGRIVCVPEELHRLHDAELPHDHAHQWGLSTTNGTIYTVLRATYSEAIYLDGRLREKDLIVKARVFPKSQVIELAHVRSLVNGLEHVLYYWCDVCAIKMVSPELCLCCQGPVRLIEKPVTDRSEVPD